MVLGPENGATWSPADGRLVEREAACARQLADQAHDFGRAEQGGVDHETVLRAEGFGERREVARARVTLAVDEQQHTISLVPNEREAAGGIAAERLAGAQPPA